MIKSLHFKPFWFLKNPHYQTIFGTYLTLHPRPPSKRELIRLPDGDFISVEITTPKSWSETDPTILIAHGLCGSSESPHPLRLARKAWKLGMKAVRFNIRGQGSGRGLAKKMFHAGRSEDLLETIKFLKKAAPNSPVTLVGFSYSGNSCLRLAGELKDSFAPFLHQVIVVNSSIDLELCAKTIVLPHNAPFARFFIKRLRDYVEFRHKTFPDLPPFDFHKKMRLDEFDRQYIAPQAGYKTAADYYTDCSAKNYLADIRVPTKLLFSADDPIVTKEQCLMAAEHPNLEVFETAQGGHMGYIANPFAHKKLYWVDSVILSWILYP